MRNSNVKRNAVVKVARLMILVLAFTLTFALALGLSLTGGVGEFNGNLSNVASAAESAEIKGAGTFGATTNKVGGANGALTVSNFNFPGVTSTTTTWSATDTIKTNGSTSTIAMYKSGGDGTKMFIDDTTGGSYSFGISNGKARYRFAAVMHYEIGDFLKQLLNNGFQVTAKLTADFSSSQCGSGYVFTSDKKAYYMAHLAASSTGYTAQQADTNRGDSFASTDSKSWSQANVETNEVTLTKSNQCLSMYFVVDYAEQTTSEVRRLTVSNLRLSLTIKYVNSDSITYDGGNPIKVSDVYGESNTNHGSASFTATKGFEYYSPYRTTVSSAWPLYYTTIENDLANAVDKRDNSGNWTLSAYTSSSIGTISGASYYKAAQVEFADTYNYSQGTASSTNLDIAKYKANTSNYRNTAGIGGYTPSGTGTGFTLTADSNANSVWTKVCSGIKTVTATAVTESGGNTESGKEAKVTLSEVTASNSTAMGTSNKSGTVAITVKQGTSTITVGYLVVGKFNRARVRVYLYMCTNAKITLQIADYGNGLCTYTTDFKGIDTTPPTNNTSINLNTQGYISNSTAGFEAANSKWFRQTLFAPDVSASSEQASAGQGGTPYVWFYTVQRADTPEGLGDPVTFSSRANLIGYRTVDGDVAHMYPIAFGSIANFQYDFENGGAVGYNTTFKIGNPKITSNDTLQHKNIDDTTDYLPRGEGYYRFNFYVVDAAGNLSSTVNSYYVKVDFGPPDGNVDLAYTYDNVSFEPILPSDFDFTATPNVLKWSTAETRFTFTLNNVNFSGNTLVFTSGQTGGTTHILQFTRDGIKTFTGGSPTQNDDGSWTLRITTGLGQTDIYVSYSVSKKDEGGNTLADDVESYKVFRYEGIVTIEFEGRDPETNKYPNVAWVTNFTVYAGLYANQSAISSDNDKLSWFDSSWGRNKDGQMHILIDRNIPDVPELETSGDYLVSGAEYDFESIVRNWYTSYALQAKLSTVDDIGLNDTYGSGVRVYRGIKYITTAAELAELAAHNIEDNYQYINHSNIDTTYRGWFTNFSDFLFSDWSKGFSLELLEGSGSGMRVLYLWIVDQAGQISSLATYYILADNNTYTVNSTVFDNPAFEDTVRGNIAQGKFADDKITDGVKTFRRGETVSLTFDLIEDAYVPYLLTMTKGSEKVHVFENYSARRAFAVADAYADLAAFRGYESVNNSGIIDTRYTVTITLDDSGSLARLDSTINFELSNRFVVSYAYDSKPVTYTALPAVVTVMNLNDSRAASHFKFLFVDDDNNLLYATKDGGFTTNKEDENVLVENGEPVLFVAVNAGTYKVRVFIPIDDDTYVISASDFDDDGMPVFRPETFIIDQGTVNITPVATTSVYGNNIILEFTKTVTNDVDIDNGTERLTGSLKLNLGAVGIDWAVNALVPVGQYEITENDADPFRVSDNFRITITNGIFHQISAREIDIVAWNETKNYGDVNPQFRFGVDTTAFEWYTKHGNEYTVDRVLDEIFGLYNVDVNSGANGVVDGYKLYFAGDLIGCEATRLSAVGRYPFTADPNAFNTNSRNFTLSVSVDGKFLTVNQRTVTIGFSGQFTVVGSGTQIDTTSVRPSYEISPDDRHLEAEITALLNGKLTISSEKHIETVFPSEYSGMEWYQILLGDTTNDNILFVLGENARYIVYFAGADSIIIGVVDGETFEFPFGTRFTDNLISYAAFADKFVVRRGDEVLGASDFDTVTWTIDIANATRGEIVSTGSRQVTISNIKIFKNGQELVGQVFADSFSLTITPSTIVVRPSVNAASGYQTYHKTYGDLESVFGFDFEIVGIQMGDTLVESNFESTFGYSAQQLRAAISGEYARAMFAQDGSMSRPGYRLDSATDANGFVLSASGATTDYYSFYEGTPFNSMDNNFTVVAQLDESVRLFIDPKAINLDLSNFVGINKTYDGYTDVPYPDNFVVYDLSNQMISASDSVILRFNAEYTEAGSLNKLTEPGIRFSDFRFDENSVNAFNYVLGTVSNTANPNSEGELFDVDGNKVFETAITDGVSLIIYYIDNINNLNHITIYTGKVGLTQNDFVIEKVYDNTTTLTIDHVKVIESAEDTDGYSSKVVYNIWKDGGARFIEQAAFGDSEAKGYTIGNLKFFFPIEGASGLDINTEGKYAPSVSRITVRAGFEDGVEGIFVEITNMSATITPRVLTADSFEEIRTIDRDYNGTARVYTEFLYKDGVLAEGDTDAGVGLRLMATISDGNETDENHIRFGAGNHNVSFADYSNKTVIDAPDNTTIQNKNYSIDIDSLNAMYALTVQINKAKLTPNVSFGDKNYNGKTDVPIIEDNEGLTVVGSAETLADELATFSLIGTLTYELSSFGQPDANVAVDNLGNVTTHNIMVKGMGIIEDSGDKNYLRNYEIDGYFYINNKYVAVGEVIGDLVSGEEIGDYEIMDEMTVNKMPILIRANNVIVEEKIYDGTRNANVTISLENSGVVEGHEKHLMITASGLFARNIVSDNVPVSIFDVVLTSLDPEGEKVINNYQLSEYTANRTASILPRPVAVTTDLGEKIYNGLAEISNNQMSFRIDGILDSEYSGYAVQASGGAYFWDKNVAVEYDEKGNVVKNEDMTDKILSKPGTVYNPILRNNRGKVNYTIVYAPVRFDEEKGEYVNYKDGDNYVAYVDANGTWHYNQKAPEGSNVTYYYALPTADRYISATETELLAAADGYIAGYYNLGGVGVYVIDSRYEGETSGNLETPVTYMGGEGRILQRSISIASSGIIVNSESTAFTKMYDGTTKFFGSRYDEENPDKWDYSYAAGSILGVVNNDHVEIGGINAAFVTASTTANYVIFTPNDIKGSDVTNYCIDGTIASARVRGKIVKRTIDAILADGEMEYGTPIGSVGGLIEYKVHGNGDEQYDLTLWEDGFYLSFANYTEMMGFGIGNFENRIKDRLYTSNIAGGFDKVTDEDYDEDDLLNNQDKYFVQLSGITAFPSVKAEFPAALPNAGTEATRYILGNVNINNYAYNPVYTKEGTSVLKVVKKDIFVATDGAAYTKKYAGNNPQIEVYYVDKDGNPGFVSPDNAVTVFREGSKDFYPVVKYGIYDETTNEVTPIGKYPVLSELLAPTQRYVIYFDMPEGANYDELIPNYNIHLGETYEINDEGVLVLRYCEADLKTRVSELTIVLPEIAGLSLRGAQDNIFNVTYDGTNLTSSVLLGSIREGDELYISNGEGEDEKLIAAIDAGEYTGIVKVFRPVKIDDGDSNGYKAVWQSNAIVTIIVDKASPQLNVFGGAKSYDGKAFEYGVSGSNNMISYKQGDGIIILNNYADIKYELLVDGKYVEVDEMRNAGTYRVSVSLNEKFALDKENRNYAPETATAQYTITKAVVTVNIADGDYEKAVVNGENLLGAVYEDGKEYVINYTMSMAANVPSDIRLPKDKTRIVFSKDITAPGIYKFDVEIADGKTFDKNNYSIVGAKGTLELTTMFVETSNGKSSVQMSDAIVANRFVAQEIIDGRGTVFDLDYWSKVDAYMPHIDSNATLAAIVRTTLYYGQTVVDLDGSSIAVSVALPEELGNMDGIEVYIVNRQGGLTRLTDYNITADGKIEYTTDYLSALVFIDMHPAALPLWAIILISVTAGIIGISIIWAGIALFIRKARLKKMQ